MPGVGRAELRLGVHRADDIHAPIVCLARLRFPGQRVVPVAQLALVLAGVMGARPGQVRVVVALDDFLAGSVVTLMRPPAQGGVAVGHLRDGVRIVEAQGGQPELCPMGLVDGVRGEVATAFYVATLLEPLQRLTSDRDQRVVLASDQRNQVEHLAGVVGLLLARRCSCRMAPVDRSPSP